MKDVKITDFTNPLFQKAFKLYFEELGISVKQWDALFAEMNENKDTKAFIRISDADQIVGFVQFEPITMSNWFFSASLGFIREFWVAKECRRKGNGTDLLKLAETDFMNNGIFQSILTTDTAPEFYEKNGYSKSPSFAAKNKDDVYTKELKEFDRIEREGFHMIKHENANGIPANHKCEHDGYEYYKRAFLPKGAAKQCAVSVYEIPPQKSGYPYHFHTQNEEVFYIISGEGLLKTPDGERSVSAGDLLYFPAEANGAHKLINPSKDTPLVYVDFDTVNGIDVALYPDSNKIGIWGMGINKVFKADEAVDYYDGE